MASLDKKTEQALNDGRILMLGSQVLVGFQYRTIVEKGFETLPAQLKYVEAITLGLMLAAAALLMLVAPYHRIVDGGENTPAFQRFMNRVIQPPVLLFAIALGFDLSVSAYIVVGWIAAVVFGVVTAAIAAFAWFGLGRLSRKRQKTVIEKPETDQQSARNESGATPIAERVSDVLVELRVVLPGVQALLGFQLIAMLSEGFSRLPLVSREVHLASLVWITISMVLLMTPAAYHRIAEGGEDTESFERFATRCMLTGMTALAFGLSGDFYVVVAKVSHSRAAGVILGAAMLLFYLGAWFGYTLRLRRRRQRQII